MPFCSSTHATLDLPLIGPTRIFCSMPNIPAGTPEYTRSASQESPFLNALTTAAAWTPVAVSNASLPNTG